MQAYLVIRQGSRWSDVFRLQPGKKVTIGRASSNAIVVPEERCSRVHAEISFDGNDWIIRDLQSRNGVKVNGTHIADPHPLKEGEVIEVASCNMAFVRSVADAFSSTSRWRSESELDPGAIDLTGTFAPSESIVERRQQSGLLDGYDVLPSSNSLPAATAQRLFALAFELANQPSAESASQIALDMLLKETGIGAGGVLLIVEGSSENSKSNTSSSATLPRLSLLAAKEALGKSYRRASDFLVATVVRDRQGVLARNIQEDQKLAMAQASETRTTSSVICAPISKGEQLLGLIHLYSTDNEPMLSPAHLQISLAVGENLALAIDKLRVKQELEYSLQQARKKAEQLEERLGQRTVLVGDSQALRTVRQAISRAAPTNATVLIRGESGVGKELVAQLLHESSPRRDGPFICVNCAALSPTLLESELFGHEKGAFTGAHERKIGRFEAAHTGTLMLDEIGEMSPEIQSKFLRVIETRMVERLGSHKPIAVDVRIVAATNRDLEEAVSDGLFRSDLYFRLRVIELKVPPLRARPEDVSQLAEFFLKRFANESGRRIEGIRPEAKEKLEKYGWPGNIRELKNVIERAVVLGCTPWIEVDDLTLDSLQLSQPAEEAVTSEYRPMTIDEMEREHILATLRATQGNKSRSASILGIERSTLDRKLQRYNITQQHYRSDP